MAIAHVQSTKKVTNATFSTTLAYGSNVTAGNTLITTVSNWQSQTGNTIGTPTDTRTNTYLGITVQQNVGSFVHHRSFYCDNTTGGANTVSYTISGTGFCDPTVSISEWSGMAAAPSLDKTNVANGTSATGSAGATGTLSQADEMIYAAVTHDGNDTAITEDTADSFLPLQENEGGSSNTPTGTQYKIVSATTDTTPNWTFGASRNYLGHVGTFKAAVAAATGMVRPVTARQAVKRASYW